MISAFESVTYGDGFEVGRQMGRAGQRTGTPDSRMVKDMERCLVLGEDDLPLSAWAVGRVHGYTFGWVEAVIIDGRQADRNSAPVQAPGE